MPPVTFAVERGHKKGHMSQDLEMANDRRGTKRFSVNASLTLFDGKRTLLAYTRDLSNRGVYFYLSTDDSKQISGDLDFTVDLPPEITLSASCRIRCRGRMVRTENAPGDLRGVAAEILDYSILREPVAVA
jgi:hypothetical protein